MKIPKECPICKQELINYKFGNFIENNYCHQNKDSHYCDFNTNYGIISYASIRNRSYWITIDPIQKSFFVNENPIHIDDFDELDLSNIMQRFQKLKLFL